MQINSYCELLVKERLSIVFFFPQVDRDALALEQGKESQEEIPTQTEANQVVAQFRYEACQPEDLEFQKGDIIFILSQGK